MLLLYVTHISTGFMFSYYYMTSRLEVL